MDERGEGSRGWKIAENCNASSIFSEGKEEEEEKALTLFIQLKKTSRRGLFQTALFFKGQIRPRLCGWRVPILLFALQCR